jgi:hypothetical protein
MYDRSEHRVEGSKVRVFASITVLNTHGELGENGQVENEGRREEGILSR